MGEQQPVPEPTNQKSIFRFGLYELDGGTGELRKDGKPRPRVQGQPLEILLHLLARPGDVVTREELRLRLWPADTFVDYDHSLNTAVNKLRDALNDSADNPRFIQTIPRRGYRFIASVEIVADAASEIRRYPNRKPAPRGNFAPRFQRKTQFRAQRCARSSRRAARRRANPFFAHSSHVSLLLRHLAGPTALGGDRCFPRRFSIPSGSSRFFSSPRSSEFRSVCICFPPPFLDIAACL